MQIATVDWLLLLLLLLLFILVLFTGEITGEELAHLASWGKSQLKASEVSAMTGTFEPFVELLWRVHAPVTSVNELDKELEV